MFSSSQSTAVQLVDKATSDLLASPDWTLNMKHCDLLNASSGQVKDVVKAARKRIGSKNRKTQLLALTLRGVHVSINLSPNSVHKSAPGVPCRWHRAGHLEGERLPGGYPEGRWLVVRQLGRVLHVRHVVRDLRAGGRGGAIRDVECRPQGGALPVGQAAAGRGVGGELLVEPRQGDRPHLVNTAWAMLALMEAEQHLRDPRPLHAAARVLVIGQMENGDFPQEDIIGVFNGNCMISYSAYRNIFPIWALGVYRSKVLKQTIMA